MARGAFWVGFRPEHPGEIYFAAESKEPIPADQAALQLEVAATESVLASFLSRDSPTFKLYQGRLLSLAQAGLVGESAQPDAARSNLSQLQEAAVAEFGPSVKRRHLRSLAKASVVTGAVLMVVGLVNRALSALLGGDFSPYFFVLGGAMFGVIASFGVRKSRLAFRELQNVEADFLDHRERLLVTGILTFILALSFATKLVVVSIGGTFSTDAFLSRPDVALLVGLLCGFSEQALPTKVAEKAQQFLSFESAPGEKKSK